MVEQEAVNFEVAGSSPAVGAKKKAEILSGFSFFLCSGLDPNQQHASLSGGSCWFVVAS